MENIYYVVKKQLQDVGGIEETTGLKDIYIYEVCPHSMSLVELASIIGKNNYEVSEQLVIDYIEEKIEIDKYNLIEL